MEIKARAFLKYTQFYSFLVNVIARELQQFWHKIGGVFAPKILWKRGHKVKLLMEK